MGTVGPLERTWQAQATVLSSVRRAVREWGGLAGLADEVVEDLELLVTEAASNSVEHAYRGAAPGDFALSMRLGPDGAVRVRVRDFGRWHPPPADPGYRGRGLAVIDTLGRDVALDVGPSGTRIAFTVDATPASVTRASVTPSGPATWWPPGTGRVDR